MQGLDFLAVVVLEVAGDFRVAVAHSGAAARPGVGERGSRVIHKTSLAHPRGDIIRIADDRDRCTSDRSA